MECKWQLKPSPDENLVTQLCTEIYHSEKPAQRAVIQLLLQRGIYTYSQAKTFFNPSLDDLHDPFLMKDMDKAVKRILQAIDNQENILIYGDYDVDGTTAVSLFYLFLSEFYQNVTYYIPDRYKEGYGVSYQGIDYANDNAISLIITLDCGIKAVEKVEYAKKIGIDVIICDHHTPSDELPQAVAILNPKQTDCTYPYDELCGCGIGFKLAQAINLVFERPKEAVFKYLDLVAIAIAADIVPVTGENRILLHFGLQFINKNPSFGVEKLLQSVKKPYTTTDLVFIIAPRINAAGRMAHANCAVELLTQKDSKEIIIKANEIEILNAKRKRIDEEITQEALEQIIENQEENRNTTVVYHPLWHKGVIGIVASRLIETYYRPTLVFTENGDKLAASARSVSGFNIYNALEACQEHLLQFGGHKYAAGLTLAKEKYEIFKKTFENIVSQTMDKELLIPKIMIDIEINLEDISSVFYQTLERFSPFGPQNMTPVFLSKKVIAKEFRAIGDGTHLRVVLTNPEKTVQFVGIGFGLAEKINILKTGKLLEMVYQIEENTWNGITNIQLKIKDIR
ncbi:MAG: single-stranded-DNA-specific exonuclease RecJ [Capnocytophaga sp.]|nr:single-stranded-DNA-specific exonuclease RecJ [Capnocytophaga sp.]